MNLSGNPLDFLIAFAGGVGVSFTACVLPLIPISASYIGVTAGVARRKGFLLSFVYVTGIAITYSLLGIIAALTGSFFGAISAHPLSYLLVGLVVIGFGVSMFDVFHIHLPVFVKPPKVKKQGFFAAFLLGLTSGLIASPCLTPVLGSILLYVSTKKDIVYGAGLLICFAYGMGTLLIIVGTFSSLLLNLPKSGTWMGYVKKTGGIILIGLGIYFLIVAKTRM